MIFRDAFLFPKACGIINEKPGKELRLQGKRESIGAVNGFMNEKPEATGGEDLPAPQNGVRI